MGKYTADSIETLEFKDAVRLRVGMYLGSDDNEGVLQAIREIITNSIDEYTIGYGDKIEVTIKGNEVEVRDYARGVPFGKRQSSDVDAMIAIYMLPHSGAKFSDDTYKNVAGLHGTGAKATALSAAGFEAVSYRGGDSARLVMKDGELISYTQSKTKEKDGTYVKFTPSQEVFKTEPISIEKEAMIEMLEIWSYLSKGLKITLNYNGEKHTFYNKNGIADLVKNSGTVIHKNLFTYQVEEDGETVEVAFKWGTNRKEDIHTFVNGLHIPEGGTPTTGARTALTRTTNSIAKMKLSGDSVRRGITMAINCSVKEPSFANQTKSRVSNPVLRGLADKAVSEAIREFSSKYSSEWEKIVELFDKEEKAEKAAEKAREAILSMEKELVKSTNRRGIDLPDKVADATNKTGYRELFLSEGDSASAYLKSTRDAATQGVMPLRGKILNTYNLELHEAYENEEVQAIFTLLGSGAGNVYNAKKLRYQKIIIASDSDSDGDHISLLLVALFLEHTPQLIEDGKLYRVIAPFYGVGSGRNYKLLYSDQELIDYEKKHGKQKNIDRFKGLGALNEDLAEKYIMNPDYRKLVQIKMEDLEEMRELFDTLMGKDLEGRRKLVREGGYND